MCTSEASYKRSGCKQDFRPGSKYCIGCRWRKSYPRYHKRTLVSLLRAVGVIVCVVDFDRTSFTSLCLCRAKGWNIPISPQCHGHCLTTTSVMGIKTRHSELLHKATLRDDSHREKGCISKRTTRGSASIDVHNPFFLISSLNKTFKMMFQIWI